ERVDDHRLVRPRHLHDAELGPEGRLAQEFGVDGDEGMAREPFANGGKFGVGSYEIHDGFIAELVARDDREGRSNVLKWPRFSCTSCGCKRLCASGPRV